jgi:hypothetical protein
MSKTQFIFPPQPRVLAFTNKPEDGLLVNAETCNCG